MKKLIKNIKKNKITIIAIILLVLGVIVIVAQPISKRFERENRIKAENEKINSTTDTVTPIKEKEKKEYLILKKDHSEGEETIKLADAGDEKIKEMLSNGTSVEGYIDKNNAFVVTKFNKEIKEYKKEEKGNGVTIIFTDGKEIKGWYNDNGEIIIAIDEETVIAEEDDGQHKIIIEGNGEDNPIIIRTEDDKIIVEPVITETPSPTKMADTDKISHTPTTTDTVIPTNTVGKNEELQTPTPTQTDKITESPIPEDPFVTINPSVTPLPTITPVPTSTPTPKIHEHTWSVVTEDKEILLGHYEKKNGDYLCAFGRKDELSEYATYTDNFTIETYKCKKCGKTAYDLGIYDAIADGGMNGESGNGICHTVHFEESMEMLNEHYDNCEGSNGRGLSVVKQVISNETYESIWVTEEIQKETIITGYKCTGCGATK